MLGSQAEFQHCIVMYVLVTLVTVALCSRGSDWAWEYVDKTTSDTKKSIFTVVAAAAAVKLGMWIHLYQTYIFVIKSFDDLTSNKLTTPIWKLRWCVFAFEICVVKQIKINFKIRNLPKMPY